MTFSEDMDDGTVSAADFANAGTAPISIGTITETTPGVFTVLVTPTDAGTLRLEIPAGAIIDRSRGQSAGHDSAIVDDTILVIYMPDSPYADIARHVAGG